VQASALPIKGCLGFILVLAASISLNAWCQQDPGQDPNIYERIWAVPVLYQNTDNPTLQSFSLIGRYHGQYWNVRADQGDANDWENRRKIVGFSSKWFQDFTVQAQMFLKTDGGSLYGGLYEGFIKWAPAGTDFSLSVGRLDYLFTGFERSKSSKKINVIERGLLVNQIMPAEVVGAHLKGKKGRFSYHAGWFSSSIEQEFDDFKSGSAGVVGGSYDTPLFYKEGSLHLDYLHNSGKSEDNAFRPYRNVVSLWHRGESGRLGMGVDLTYAEPLETDGHVFGLTIEPTWVLLNEVFGSNDPLQLAVRYQYASSTEDNGLSLQRRYEQKVTQGNGDRYQALYTGLNYYLYGHKLKLMAGGEYAQMKDAADDGGKYNGWTWFGAIRLYF
jgi:phosphate-selective porin OprO/OprP